MADETVKEVETDEKVDYEREAAEKKAEAVNNTRSGVGTRQQVGRTRGKASLVITYEAFDESKPDTLPTSIPQFMEVTNVKQESAIVAMLIEGFNSTSYTAASDPLAEYVNYSWPSEAQAQFRIVVRQYSRGANVPLESAVALIKPGFDKQFASK